MAATADNNLSHVDTGSQQAAFVSDSLAFGVLFAITLTVIQRAVGFARGILFCRIMTDQELGQWSMVYSFLMLLAPLAVLGLPGCFGRFSEHYLKRNQLGVFVRRISMISYGMTGVLALTMYASPEWYSQVIFRTVDCVSVVNAMAFSLIMVAASNFLSTLMESLRQIRLATLMRFVQGTGFAIFGTLLISQWQDSTVGATIGFGIASFLACVPAAWFLVRYREGFVDSGAPLTQWEMWKRIAPFALWLWASNFIWNLFEVADRYMLVHWSDASAAVAQGFVGQYHSGRVIPMLLVGVAVVLEGMLMPYITVLWEKQKQKDAGELVVFSIKLVAIGFTGAALVIILFSPWLFEIVLQGKYDQGFAVLPLTFVFSIWFSVFMFAQIFLWVAEKGKIVFGIGISGLLLNLSLNAWWIPSLEIWGAIGATTTATLFCLVTTNLALPMAGCRLDGRVWACCGLPLVVLVPIGYALATFGLVAVVAIVSTLFFSRAEKQLLKAEIENRLSAWR